MKIPEQLDLYFFHLCCFFSLCCWPFQVFSFKNFFCYSSLHLLPTRVEQKIGDFLAPCTHLPSCFVARSPPCFSSLCACFSSNLCFFHWVYFLVFEENPMKVNKNPLNFCVACEKLQKITEIRYPFWRRFWTTGKWKEQSFWSKH